MALALMLAATAPAAAQTLAPAAAGGFKPSAAEPPKPAPPAASPTLTDPAKPPPPLLESETSDIATLPPATPHRVFLATRGGGITIINGDTAKIEGTVNSTGAAGFAVAPDNGTFYVSETIWTKQNRGIRQDMVSVYDGTTLLLKTEIKLPGRLIASGRIPFFSLNASGTRGFVYNMEPAASAIVVDLLAGKVISTVETPGCGLVYPFRDEGFASLCADGSLASVRLDAKGRGTITHSPVFFDAEKDPVFEESIVDRAAGKALFITYTGMVYPATLGATSTIGQGWSLQRAAGLAAATTAPQQKTWRPGGRRPFAWHPASGRLFVLMHEGNHWTQKASGTEVWVIDAATQALVTRYELPTAGYTIAVSQDADPQLYVASEDGWFWRLDPQTGKVQKALDDLGRPGLMAMTGF
ncbi:amine dehydrogenase large subunit [Sphingomonas profundi]|uniref:amine dehydrogenase large subunit n=1 Tax=Alterirhizorhabdus profundi TaxID=2681549 RepID=UPI0018CFF1B1|nr:amine dehydrogenase large subunit [Sphingomonas profundi]